jgi:Holliday junction resolvase RusA-like endonuclease
VISFFVPGKPKAKERPRFANGRVYTPKSTVAQEASFAWHAVKAYRGPLLEGPLEVTVTVYRTPLASLSKAKKSALIGKPCTMTPDLDNAVKLLDGLNRVIWRDDAQIVRLTASKVYSDKPGVAVEIREVA